MMDGLVSNFALIAGVAGAGSTVSRHAVTLAGLAGLVGGAFSMATGEYVSVQSQNESARAEIEVERRELRRNSAAEQAELAQMYVQRGVEADLASRVAAQLSRDPDQALDIHVREELGVSPHALPSPWVAAGSSLLSFSVGALLPLLPYVAGVTELWVSAVVSIAALFGAGALTAQFTSRSWQFSAIRQVLLGGFAAAVTYGVGQAFGAVTG
jgi:VIT1/CCC1 family predicted Fe2+/Mn2+ transporter